MCSAFSIKFPFPKKNKIIMLITLSLKYMYTNVTSVKIRNTESKRDVTS